MSGWWGGLLALALVLAACGPGATPGAPPATATGVTAAGRPAERVRLAYSSIAGVTVVPLLAQERGLFAANNLDVELVYIASGATAMQALLAGEVQCLMGGTEAIVSAAAAGANLRIFGGLVDVVPFSLVVRPEIADAQGLRGQRLGVTRLGSATDYALRAGVRTLGLEPDRDVAVAQMGGIPEIYAGLESGAVAGGTLSLPVLAQAQRAGYRTLLDLAAAGIPYQTTSVATTAQLASERPATVTALLRALAQAIHVIKTDRAGTIATLQALINEDDPQVLEETYERYGQQYIERIPAPSRVGIEAVREQLAATDSRVAAVKLDELIDERPIRALESEGLFTKLYGGS